MSTFGFGSQTVTQTPAFGGFSFSGSTNTTSTPSVASAPFSSFGSNVSSTGITFGTPSISSTGGFGAPAASSSLFPSLSQTTTSAPSSGFSFGGTATTTNNAFGFGANPTGTTSGFGTANSNAGTSMGFGAQLTATTTAPSSIGLGGVDSTAPPGLDGANAAGKKDNKAVKETLIPAEISVTVESFKKYIKDQKVVREEISRVSGKNIFRVQNQVASLRQQLSVVTNGLQRNAIAISKLKQESGEELKNAEIAQRTKETPPALQYENTAPAEYFHKLAINFEHQMQAYRQQIEQLERHLLSLSQPSVLTSNDLNAIMRKLHDAFVTLAAQLQTTHQQVQYNREQFLAIQKANHSDVSDVFQSRKDTSRELSSSNYIPLPVTTGPSPVSSTPYAAAVALANARNRTQQFRPDGMNLNTSGFNTSGLSTGLSGGSLLNSSQTGFGSSFGVQNASTFKPLGQTTVPFGNTGFGGGTSFTSDITQSPYGLNEQKTFQLQKPPAGNKRGKRWTST